SSNISIYSKIAPDSRTRFALFRWRFRFGRSGVSAPLAAVLHPMPLARFHLFQTLLLFRREVLRNLAMRSGDRFPHALAGIAADLLQLCASLFDNRRNLGHLFVGQPKLPFQMVLHRSGGKTGWMLCENEMMADRHRHKN